MPNLTVTILGDKLATKDNTPLESKFFIQMPKLAGAHLFGTPKMQLCSHRLVAKWPHAIIVQ